MNHENGDSNEIVAPLAPLIPPVFPQTTIPVHSVSALLIHTPFTAFLYHAQHIVRRLKHPNICAYMGVCIAAPWFSLVYEYLEHGSLSERLRRVPGAGLPTTKRRSSPSSSESDGGKGDGGENGRRNLLPLGTAALLGIGEDVAEGMRYLHQVSILLKRACCRRSCVAKARSWLSPYANRTTGLWRLRFTTNSCFRRLFARSASRQNVFSHVMCTGLVSEV